MSSSSTNKYSMLSIDNWATVLVEVDEDHFKHDALVLHPKAFLCKLGCWVANLDPTSALVSRKLLVIGRFMAGRSKELGDRYKIVQFHVDAEQEKFRRCHGFDEDGGSFYSKWADEAKTSGTLVHRGTGLEVPIPKEFLGQEIKIVSNHQDDLASLKGEFSDPKIQRVFEKAGITLPKLHYQKKITDSMPPPSSISPSSAASPQVTLTSETLTALAVATAAEGTKESRGGEPAGNHRLPSEVAPEATPPSLPK